jgi:hypothetical protein
MRQEWRIAAARIGERALCHACAILAQMHACFEAIAWRQADSPTGPTTNTWSHDATGNRTASLIARLDCARRQNGCVDQVRDEAMLGIGLVDAVY